jgi:hypothetical protein
MFPPSGRPERLAGLGRGHYASTAVPCADCERAEQTPSRRLLGAAARAIQPRPSPAMTAAAGMAATTRALLGGPPPPSLYEQHREAYVRTGDPAELERMLRHVTADAA